MIAPLTDPLLQAPEDSAPDTATIYLCYRRAIATTIAYTQRIVCEVLAFSALHNLSHLHRFPGLSVFHLVATIASHPPLE